MIDRGLAAPALRGSAFLLDWSYGNQDFNSGFPGRINGDLVDIGAVESPFLDRPFNDRFRGNFGPFDSAHLIHHRAVARGRQVLWPERFATESTGSVLACTVRMLDRAKRPGRGAWRLRSRQGGE